MIKNILIVGYSCLLIFTISLCIVSCHYSGDSILNYKGAVVVEIKNITKYNSPNFLVFVRLKEDNKWVIKSIECKDGDLFQVGDTIK